LTKKLNKTMKTITLTLILSLFTLGIFSQTGNLGDKPDECKKYLSLYGDYLKQKMYVDSYKFWKGAVTVCPEYNANLYENGIYIMKKLQKGATKERKAALADSIVWAYEQSINLFGDNPSINEDFGIDLIKSKKVERGVELVKKALDSSENKARASTIYYYSMALAVLKNKDKKDCEVLVKEYDRLSSINDANSGSNGYDKSQEAVDKFLGPCLSCDNLLPIIRKKFELAKTDANERKKILTTLERRECTNNDIYETLNEIDVKENPTADGYRRIAQIYINKGEKSKAKVFFDKAIELADSNEDKVKYMLDAASNFPRSAGSYANDALAMDPNCGTAYLIKARNIANSKCGTSAFDDRAINWAAYDMAAKAKSVDSSVASKASKDMLRYKAGFPSTKQIFEQGGLSTGDSYKTCNGYSTTVK
jgi:tetratricopeptide (TPR) repeat protein|tara:strand:+ start:9118 stop:10383 length:1266 start_codon:yes stop_codon:yes gene_type:complete